MSEEKKLTEIEKLTEMLISGDELKERSAFESIYKQEATLCFKIAYKVVKQNAEDVVQETFIKLWENRKKIDIAQGYRCWLYTILNRTAISELRDIIRGGKRRDPTPVEDISRSLQRIEEDA